MRRSVLCDVFTLPGSGSSVNICRLCTSYMLIAKLADSATGFDCVGKSAMCVCAAVPICQCDVYFATRLHVCVRACVCVCVRMCHSASVFI